MNLSFKLSLLLLLSLCCAQAQLLDQFQLSEKKVAGVDGLMVSLVLIRYTVLIFAILRQMGHKL